MAVIVSSLRSPSLQEGGAGPDGALFKAPLAAL